MNSKHWLFPLIATADEKKWQQKVQDAVKSNDWQSFKNDLSFDSANTSASISKLRGWLLKHDYSSHSTIQVLNLTRALRGNHNPDVKKLRDELNNRMDQGREKDGSVEVDAVQFTKEELEQQGYRFEIVAADQKKEPDHWQVSVEKDGKTVGEMICWYRSYRGAIQVVWIRISEEERRKGIATAMYDLAEKTIGAKIKPSEDLSLDSYSLWTDRLKNDPEKLKQFEKEREDRELRNLDTQYSQGTPKTYKKKELFPIAALSEELLRDRKLCEENTAKLKADGWRPIDSERFPKWWKLRKGRKVVITEIYGKFWNVDSGKDDYMTGEKSTSKGFSITELDQAIAFGNSLFELPKQ